MGKYYIQDLGWYGKYHDYFFDPNLNPSAYKNICIANCTGGVLGYCLIEGDPFPVSQLRNANVWHKYITKDYSLTSYAKSKLKKGDVIEWINKCHVVKVADVIDGEVYVHSSWYTGEHGKSVYNGDFDTRNGFSTMEQWANWCLKNYAYRYYHYCTIEEEIKGVGGTPEYILSLNTKIIYPVERNASVDQLQVNTDEQNIRDNPDGNVIGKAKQGYYNVLSRTDKNGYTWNEVEEGIYIASGGNVGDRVVFIPATNDDYYKELYWQEVEENKKLKNQLDQIARLCEYE